jgi:uncharacterized OB-fold protein
MSAAPAPLESPVHDFHIDLERACLCADCGSIYSLPRSTCPSCTSRSAVPLARVLSERTKPAAVTA